MDIVISPGTVLTSKKKRKRLPELKLQVPRAMQQFIAEGAGFQHILLLATPPFLGPLSQLAHDILLHGDNVLDACKIRTKWIKMLFITFLSQLYFL